MCSLVDDDHTLEFSRLLVAAETILGHGRMLRQALIDLGKPPCGVEFSPSSVAGGENGGSGSSGEASSSSQVRPVDGGPPPSREKCGGNGADAGGCCYAVTK